MTDANASRAPSDASTVGSTPTSVSASIPPTGATPNASTGAGPSAPTGAGPTTASSTPPRPTSPPPPPPSRPGSYADTRAGGNGGNGTGGRTGVTALWLVLVLTIAGAAAGGYWLNKRLDDSSAALIARQSHDDATLAQTQFKSDQSLGAVHQLDNQVAALTGKVNDTQTQQQSLQQLYQDLARNRDDWVMTDAEQTLSTANQQLQLTGNTKLALYALQNADSQLATTDAPQVLEIRRAVAADIAKLQAAPMLDTTGLALRLDQIIAQVDQLPMAGDLPPADAALPASGTAVGSSSAAPGAAAANAQPNAPRPSIFTKIYWQQWWARMTHHYGDAAQRLVQVRRIDHSSADAMMVAPSQAEYLRENIKLRLLSARLSLLSRNAPLLLSDLNAADATLAQYFDPSSPITERVRTTLADVRNAGQQVSIPTLDGSLQALRQYKPRS